MFEHVISSNAFSACDIGMNQIMGPELWKLCPFYESLLDPCRMGMHPQLEQQIRAQQRQEETKVYGSILGIKL
jgi:hypothetical protein